MVNHPTPIFRCPGAEPRLRAPAIRSRGLVLTAFVALLLCSAGAESAVAGGWIGKFPPKMVTLDSGHRNHVFYVGEPVTFKLAGNDRLDRYEVRDYWGRMVDKGPAKESITIQAKDPGWYKLYVYARPAEPERPKAELDTLLDDVDKPAARPKPASTLKEAEPLKPTTPPEQLWGDIVGGTMFVIFRHDANFPELSGKDAPVGSSGSNDDVMRGITGMGPQRHKVESSKPDETIKNLELEVAIDRMFYLPFDPLRKRVLMAAFANGTQDLAGVRKIVEQFQSDVRYWEPRNEPNYGSGGADFVVKELKPFYETIKAVDPNLKVLGPGTVGIGPQLLPWIEDFLKAGGARYVDAFSFHSYNAVNGDVWLARKSLGALGALLKKYDADKLELWQTEQGFFACLYGSYQPRLQGRWTMVEMMVYEQFGIPKEHNHLWYDRSHGFWDFPTWWENDDTSLNPAAPLMRVWSEELFGTTFEKALDFGEPGNKLYVGSLFRGPHKRVAAFMSAGATDGHVPLKVEGGNTLKVVSAFGVERQLAVQQGHAVLEVPELPVYVELNDNQTIEVEPTKWGENLARGAGVVPSASGAAEHPLDKKIPNEPAKLINGELENWYWSQQPESQPWMSNVAEFPGWVEIRLPKPQAVGRVVVFAAPPWQCQGSLVDYELQYADARGNWVKLEQVTEPTQTFKVFTPVTRTSVDSFYSDRWIFTHQFSPVTTDRVRLLVNDVTWGGGATEDVTKAGGQTGPHQITLREIEIYAP